MCGQFELFGAVLGAAGVVLGVVLGVVVVVPPVAAHAAPTPMLSAAATTSVAMERDRIIGYLLSIDPSIQATRPKDRPRAPYELPMSRDHLAGAQVVHRLFSGGEPNLRMFG